MVTPQLLDYIKQCVSQGAKQEEITAALRASGWQESDIQEGFSAAAQPLPVQASTPSSKGYKTLAFVLAIVGLFVIGGGALAFVYYSQQRSPQEVMATMFHNFSEVKSMEYSGEVRVAIDPSGFSTPFLEGAAGFFQLGDEVSEEQGETPVLVTFNGAIDGNDPKKPKGDFTFDLAVQIPGGERFFANFEMRILENIVYMRLADISDIGMDEVSKIKGKWLKIDPTVLAERFGITDFEEQLKSAQEQQELSDDELRRIQEEFLKRTIVEVLKETTDAIDGGSMYHYVLKINKEELKAYLLEVNDILAKRQISKQDIADFSDAMDFIDFLTTDLWVGKADILPYRAHWGFLVKQAPNAKELAKVTAKINFKNYNKPVQIVAPPSAQPFEELLEELYPGLVPPSNTVGSSAGPLERARDAKRVHDLQSLHTALTIYYSDNDRYPATIVELVPDLAPALPRDPLDNNGAGGQCGTFYTPTFPGSGYTTGDFGYSYHVTADGQQYVLQACLEEDSNQTLASDCDDTKAMPACVDDNESDPNSPRIYDIHA